MEFTLAISRAQRTLRIRVIIAIFFFFICRIYHLKSTVLCGLGAHTSGVNRPLSRRPVRRRESGRGRYVRSDPVKRNLHLAAAVLCSCDNTVEISKLRLNTHTHHSTYYYVYYTTLNSIMRTSTMARKHTHTPHSDNGFIH